jgi:hypothetical protein
LILLSWFLHRVRDQSLVLVFYITSGYPIIPHLLKSMSFLKCMFLAILLSTRWLQMLGFISGVSTLFHWSLSFMGSLSIF